jgi:nitrite reductase (NADH) large subunit
MNKYIIIGDGAAGANGAEAIRAHDTDGSITVFTREVHPFYYRPRLPEYISGEVTLESMTMRNAAKAEALRLDFHPGTDVSAIDPAGRTVTAGGKTYPYDALLLAAGSHCFIPPVPGSDKQGVFSLKTIEDADAILAAAKNALEHKQKAALIGGGLLGLEAAHALIKLGLTVEVVEFFDRLRPRQMDAEGAAILQGILEKMGYVFHLGVQAKEITGTIENDAIAGGITLNNGGSVQAGMVLFSSGVRPNLALAEAAGLAIDKGVTVDDEMRTSVAGIWAAGDIACYQGRPGGIWPVAMTQGKCAGASMAGAGKPYQPQVPSTSLKVAGVSLTSAGVIDAAGNAALQEIRCVNGDNYRKIVLEDGVIKGYIFLGDQKGAKECAAAANKALNVSAFSAKLGDTDFDCVF